MGIKLISILVVNEDRPSTQYLTQMSNTSPNTGKQDTQEVKNTPITGADPGFQVRGEHIKKIAPSRGRRENFRGIPCEKSRFYAKKSYFFQF